MSARANAPFACARARAGGRVCPCTHGWARVDGKEREGGGREGERERERERESVGAHGVGSCACIRGACVQK